MGIFKYLYEQATGLFSSAPTTTTTNTVNTKTYKQKELNPCLESFSLVEQLAHSDDIGAYGAPSRKDGDTLSITDQNTGIAVTYRVVKIQTKSTGLVGEIFVPVDPKLSQQIYVNWTGTHSLGTLLADLESAPGEDSYRKEEVEILEQLNNVIKAFSNQTDSKVNIVVSGHSLGGALAQQNWHSIQRAIAQNVYDNKLDQKDLTACGKWIESEKQFRAEIQSRENHIGIGISKSVRSHLNADNIQSITLGVWNSAGVLKAIENNSNQLAPMVKEAGVHQRALFGMVGGDAVQTTGQGSVLSNVSSDTAEVSLVKIDKGCEGYYQTDKILGIAGGTAVALAGCLLFSAPVAILSGLTVSLLPMTKSTVTAHTAKHFNNQTTNDEIRYQLYQNNTDESRKIIHQKLTNKSNVLQFSAIKVAQQGLHYMLGNVIEASKPATQPEIPVLNRGLRF